MNDSIDLMIKPVDIRDMIFYSDVWFASIFSLQASTASAACICLEIQAQCGLGKDKERTHFITLEKAYGMTVTIMTIVINRIIQVGQICLIS